MAHVPKRTGVVREAARLFWGMALVLGTMGGFALLKGGVRVFYEEVDAVLPGLTAWALDLPGSAYVGWGVVLAAVLVLKQFVVAGEGCRRDVHGWVMLAIALTWGILVVAVLLPWIALLTTPEEEAYSPGR